MCHDVTLWWADKNAIVIENVKRREEFKLADIYTEEGYNNFTSMSYLLYNTSFYTDACIGICQEVIFGPDLLVSSFMQY